MKISVMTSGKVRNIDVEVIMNAPKESEMMKTFSWKGFLIIRLRADLTTCSSVNVTEAGD